MHFFSTLDKILNVIGFIIVGYWVLQFIYYAYVKGYNVKDQSHDRSNFWDYM